MSCRYSHRLPSENALLALLFGQELTSNQSKSAKRKMPMTTVWHPRCNSFNIFIFSTSHDQAELGTNWTNRSTPHRQWRGSHSGLHPVTVQTAKWLPHSPKKNKIPSGFSSFATKSVKEIPPEVGTAITGYNRL
jgi:hypothetical protein